MRKFIFIFIALFVLVSCSSKTPKKAENPVDLYVAGVNLMNTKKYDKAVDKFKAIREQYPFDPMALVAAVKLGDTYFLKKDYVLAAGTYEDYFKAHPDEENIPYVLFRLGECYEKLSPSIDRDQANTVKGIERITYLRNRYPTSSYAKESEARLKRFIQKLADRELYVGEFYVRTAQYNACVIRIEGMLQRYPESKNMDKALFYLVTAHRELGNQDKSDEYLQRLRREYPKSIYSRSTIRQRKTLKMVREEERKVTSPGTAAVSESRAAAAGPARVSPWATGVPVASATTSTAPAAETTAQTPQYAERKKKEIDLRPPEPGPVAQASPEPVKVAAVETARPADTPAAVTSKTKEEGGKPLEDTSKAKGTDKALGFLDRKKPIDIVSDTMEGFDKEKYVFFKGSVVARQDDLYIYSDTMEAFMSADTNEIEKANAKGNVRIIKQNRTATCKEAFFDNLKSEIILKGNAVVTSGKDKVEGDVVTYYVNEDRAVVTAEKSKKAKVTIYPQKN
ncbi:MAG: Outer membrane protein assembly factor BamD precursor [Syntrophorhabdus sp. PtaB.Bin184]|jgi:outer membrane protein assembly factor BamD|nr:MAG: Outer membrane protein assembly factor BamD precursor [Syntrophorhabdus sp. PtaB.Bin184]